jgi:hypothetical protein
MLILLAYKTFSGTPPLLLINPKAVLNDRQVFNSLRISGAISALGAIAFNKLKIMVPS